VIIMVRFEFGLLAPGPAAILARIAPAPWEWLVRLPDSSGRDRTRTVVQKNPSPVTWSTAWAGGAE